MIHWFLYHAGLTSPNSPWYLFWSGFGADWTRIFAILGLLHVGNALHRHHKTLKKLADRDDA
jgi:hypothetical protein